MNKRCTICQYQTTATMEHFCPHDSSRLIGSEDAEDLNSSDPQGFVGQTLLERYRITGRVGTGGWSTIYSAMHLAIRKQVALKVLHHHLSFDPAKLLRFQQEAEACSQINHPNVVRIYDYGTLPNGQPFIVMDYLDGKSLDQILEREHHLSVDRAIDIFSQACCALAAAHESGIVHRDLKPSNIIVTKDERNNDRVVIIDFGLAKALSDADFESLTQTGQVLGTPAYMSPEQCAGKEIDGRADIYSLGCTLFEALTGVKPFLAKTYAEYLVLHVNEPPKSFADLRLTFRIPSLIERIVRKSLQKDPALRFSSAFEMLKELWEVKVGAERVSPLQRIIAAVGKRSRFAVALTAAAALCAMVGLYFGTEDTVSPFFKRWMQTYSEAKKSAEAWNSKESLPKYQEARRLAEAEGAPPQYYAQILDQFAMAENAFVGPQRDLKLYRKALANYLIAEGPDGEHVQAVRLNIIDALLSMYGATAATAKGEYTARDQIRASDVMELCNQQLQSAKTKYGESSRAYVLALTELAIAQSACEYFPESVKTFDQVAAMPASLISAPLAIALTYASGLNEAHDFHFDAARKKITSAIERAREIDFLPYLRRHSGMEESAQWCLRHGMPDKVSQFRELEKLIGDNVPAHSS